jgi:hypothetical protein
MKKLTLQRRIATMFLGICSTLSGLYAQDNADLKIDLAYLPDSTSSMFKSFAEDASILPLTEQGAEQQNEIRKQSVNNTIPEKTQNNQTFDMNHYSVLADAQVSTAYFLGSGRTLTLANESELYAEHLFEEDTEKCTLTREQILEICLNIYNSEKPSKEIEHILDWKYEESLAKSFGVAINTKVKSVEEIEDEWWRINDIVRPKFKACTKHLKCDTAVTTYGISTHMLFYAMTARVTSLFESFFLDYDHDITFIHPEDKMTVLDALCINRRVVLNQERPLELQSMDHRYRILEELGAVLNERKRCDCGF